MRYRNNTVQLLVPDGPGVVANFAADRGQGILGARLEVLDLGAAKTLIEENTGETVSSFKYKGRERFLIPTDLSRGFLLEMVEP